MNFEMCRLDDTIVDKLQYDTVDDDMAEFLHPVACQRWPVVIGQMIKPDGRIESSGFDESFQLSGKHRIAEIQQGINRIRRRSFVAPIERQLGTVPPLEEIEIRAAGRTLDSAQFLERFNGIEPLERIPQDRMRFSKRFRQVILCIGRSHFLLPEQLSAYDRPAKT